ncbi:MAG: O-antigen polymerase, partial [Gammaproteobacteria bacterium]|nr:O-antigen polymerase [Gammaproteobacteria bacterium]
GTFKSIFPAYKDEQISASFLYAHNDYLQFVLEAGAGAILLLAIVMLSLLMAYRAMRSRHDPLYRGLGFAAFMGIMALMIHSSTDFNLQIPANALMFMLLLALAWIGCHANRQGGASKHIPEQPTRSPG